MQYQIFLGFFSSLTRAAGFRFMESNGKSLPPKVFAAYCWFTDCAMAFYVFRIICRLFQPMTFDQFMEWVPTLLYVGQVFLKGILLRIKNREIVDCVFNMEMFFQIVNSRDKEKYSKIFLKQFKLPNRFCKVIFWTQMVCLVLAYSPSAFNVFARPTANFIQFPSYYFFYEVHYSFKVSYLVLDFITSSFCCLKTSAIEMLYLTFLSYFTANLEYLRIELINIFENYSNDQPYKENFKWWLEAHKMTLSQVMLFRTFVRFLLLIIYVYNLLNIVTMVIFVTANGDMELNQKIVAVIVVTVTLFYFFWDCVLTDQLEFAHSQLMSVALCDKLTFAEQKTMKQCVMFSTLRCRSPINISAGGIFSPSCWNFKELLKTTVSVLVAIWEIKKRVKCVAKPDSET